MNEEEDKNDEIDEKGEATTHTSFLREGAY